MLSNNDNNNNNNNNNNNHNVNKREITKETNVLSTKFNDLERNYIKLDHEINRLKILETIIEKGINDELIVQNELERQDNQKEDEQIDSLMTAYNTNHEIHSLYNILYCQNSIYNDQYFVNGYQLCQKDNNIDWGMLAIIIIAYRRQQQLLKSSIDIQPEYISETITNDSITYHVRIRLIPLHHKALIVISYYYNDYNHDSNKLPDAQDILSLQNTNKLDPDHQNIIGLIALRYFLYCITNDNNTDNNDDDNDNDNIENNILIQKIIYKHIYNNDVTCNTNETLIINEILDIVKAFK